MARIATVVCNETSDDFASVRLQETDLADPGPGEVQVRTMACAVNFPDLMMVQGKHQYRPSLPFVPGTEAAGDVAAVGPGVSRFKEGDAVCFWPRAAGGCFAEAVNLPAVAVEPVPQTMTYAQAAAFRTTYTTAYLALKVRGNLQSGEWLLVHGAAGGVGMAAVELGKLYGARVIGTGGRDDKLAVVKSRGADAVINYTLADGSLGGFRHKVKEITGAGGADVIYDPVGGDVFDESMRCVNWYGRILSIGFTSGRWPKAPVNLILVKSISVIGVRVGENDQRNPALGERIRAAVGDLAHSGAIDPHICAGFPLDRAVNALRMLEDREVVGKCVVTMNGYSVEEA